MGKLISHLSNSKIQHPTFPNIQRGRGYIQGMVNVVSLGDEVINMKAALSMASLGVEANKFNRDY